MKTDPIDETCKVFNVDKQSLNKQSSHVNWNSKLDSYLAKLASDHNECNWETIANEMRKKFGNFQLTAKKCRERWACKANPAISKQPLSDSEYVLLLIYHCKLGNNWSCISSHIPKRYGSTLKNNFYSLIRSILRRILIGDTMKITTLLFLESIYISWVSVELLKRKNENRHKRGDVPPHIKALIIEKKINNNMCEQYLKKLALILIDKYKEKSSLKTLKKLNTLETFYEIFISVSNQIEGKIKSLMTLIEPHSQPEVINEIILTGIEMFLIKVENPIKSIGGQPCILNISPSFAMPNFVYNIPAAYIPITSPYYPNTESNLRMEERNFFVGVNPILHNTTLTSLIQKQYLEPPVYSFNGQ